MAEVQALYGNFVLVGKPKIAKDLKKYHSGETSEAGYEWEKVQFGVEVGVGNTLFVEVMGGHQTKKTDVIKTKDKDGNDLDVKFSDRLTKTIIDKVDDKRKFKANLTTTNNDDDKVFISSYDFVKYIHENLNTELRVVVTGSLKVEKYRDKNGSLKTSQKLIPNRIRLATDKDENKGEIRLGFIFGKDSWEDALLDDKKKIFMNCNFTSYNKILKVNEFAPLQLVLNCDKLDFSVEAHQNVFNLYKKYLTTEEDKYFLTEWHCNLFNGSEMEEITMDDLTDEEREQIVLGLAKLEDIIRDRRGSKFGDRLNEIRLIRPTNKFDGKVNYETLYEDEDFIDKEAPTSIDEVIEDSEPIADNNDSSGEIDVSKMFG